MSSDNEIGGTHNVKVTGQRGGAQYANEVSRSRPSQKSRVLTNGSYRPRASSSHAVSTSSSHSSVSMEEDSGAALVVRAQAIKDSSPVADSSVDNLVFKVCNKHTYLVITHIHLK